MTEAVQVYLGRPGCHSCSRWSAGTCDTQTRVMGAGSDEHQRLREISFIAEQNWSISGRKAPLSYHARTPTIWLLIDSGACGSASLCSASLDNV